MIRPLTWTALMLLLTCAPATLADATAAPAAQAQVLPPVTDPLPITVRPATLGDHIGTLAGLHVRVLSARVVRLYGTRAMVVETAARVRSTGPTRIVVLIDTGSLRVPASQLVGETVEIIGIARTVLGVQVGGDATWPEAIDRRAVRRLAIRGAVIASSVQTADGVELTSRVG